MRIAERGMALTASLAIVLCACQRVTPPTVEVTSVRLGSIGLRGATLVADLSIENPNDFDIETDSIAFDLEARDQGERTGWTPLTSGTLREPVRIASRGRAEVQVPAELSFSRLSAPMRSVIEMGSFNYRITGTLSIQEPRPTTAPFSQTGNISVLGSH